MRLLAALGQIQFSVGMGELNFYDSVSTALDWIAPVSGKKALVLLTTGLDSSSPARWDALVQKLRTRDVVIFPVALGGWLRRAPDKKKKATGPPKEDSQVFASADQALFRWRRLPAGGHFFRNRRRISRRCISRLPRRCDINICWGLRRSTMGNSIR